MSTWEDYLSEGALDTRKLVNDSLNSFFQPCCKLKIDVENPPFLDDLPFRKPLVYPRIIPTGKMAGSSLTAIMQIIVSLINGYQWHTGMTGDDCLHKHVNVWHTVVELLLWCRHFNGMFHWIRHNVPRSDGTIGCQYHRKSLYHPISIFQVFPSYKPPCSLIVSMNVPWIFHLVRFQKSHHGAQQPSIGTSGRGRPDLLKVDILDTLCLKLSTTIDQHRSTIYFSYEL